MKTDLIYGIEDRPPFKDALFAAFTASACYFVAIITPPLIIASALKLDVENRFLGFDVSLCFGGIYFYPVSPFWTYRGKVALYSGNKFFVYRSLSLLRDLSVDFLLFLVSVWLLLPLK